MKKILLSLVVAAAALFATSCANELEEGIKGNANGVTFEISTPELASRAFGEAKNATNLLWGVYEVNGTNLNYVENVSNTTLGSVELLDGKASVQIDLLDGYKYRLLFWAVSDTYTEAFALNFENKTLTMNPEVNGNNDAYDAFYAMTEEIDVQGAVTKSVTLTRPFAQLNIGSNDFVKATNAGMNLTKAKSTVTINGWLNTLDCVSGDATGSADITYKAAAIPTEEFTVNGYNYLAMNYVLVGKNKTTIPAVGLSVSDDTKTIINTYNNVPVQRNYRTNIYGSLLTNGSTFNVEIDETWTNPAYGEVWDGVSVATPIFDETNKVMYIHDGYQLAWLAQFVNNGNVAPTVTRAEAVPFDNTNAWTVEITNDIDLGGKAWTPIGTGKERNFRSNFNGNGHTIKGLKVEGNLDCAALFGAIATSKAASIKNLTIDGADIKGSHYAGAFAAWVQHPGDGQGNRITIENIHVKNSKVVSTPIEEGGVYDNGDKVGGVIGYAVRTVVDNCSAEKCEVTAYRDLAGVVGVANSNATVRNCSVEDVTLKINNEHNYKGYTSLAQYRVNSVTNVIADTATAENNSGEATIVDIITEAFKDNIAAGGNITFTEDVTFLGDEALEIEAGTTVEIDLGGKNFTTNGMFVNKGTLTIKNGTITSGNTNETRYGIIAEGGKTTIENVTIEHVYTAGGSAINAKAGAEVEVKNVIINAKHLVILADGENTNVTVNGGTYFSDAPTDDGTYSYGVKAQNGAVITIDGGSFEAKHGVIAAGANGHVIINDGVFFIQEPANGSGYPLSAGGANSLITVYGGKFANIRAAGASGYAYNGGRFELYGGMFKYKTFWGGVDSSVKWVNSGDAEYPWKPEVSVVSDNATLADAAKADNAIVVVPAATYNSFPAVTGNNVTIVCKEGTVFEGNSKLNINGATVIGATFSNPAGTAVDQTINGTFKNCTFTGSNGLRWCYAGETVVFENCVFSGDVYGAHFDGGANDVVFKNCVFSGFNAFAGETELVTFEGCTFKGNGKSGYNGANLWGSAKMVDCEFTFDGTTANEWIDCIGTDKTYEFSNCTVNGVNFTDANYADYDEIFSRNSASVKINGVDCQL